MLISHKLTRLQCNSFSHVRYSVFIFFLPQFSLPSLANYATHHLLFSSQLHSIPHSIHIGPFPPLAFSFSPIFIFHCQYDFFPQLPSFSSCLLFCCLYLLQSSLFLELPTLLLCNSSWSHSSQGLSETLVIMENSWCKKFMYQKIHEKLGEKKLQYQSVFLW